MIKPFDSKELVARVKAVLRRYQAARPWPIVHEQQGEYVEYPDLIVNLTNYSVIYMAIPWKCRQRSWSFIFLASSPTRYLPGNSFWTISGAMSTWRYPHRGRTYQTSPEKIKDHNSWAITTVWGIGYKFEVRGKR